MRVEDLVKDKKYRHPLFNFDLRFYEHNIFKRITGESIADYEMMFLTIKEMEQLTEVREPIKKEKVSYSYVEFKVNPSYESGSDVITGLYVCHSKDNIKTLLAEKSDGKEKAIVKHITTSIELTEEDIKKELENE
jgi:hypothetical protein